MYTLIDSLITAYSSAHEVREWITELKKMEQTPQVLEEIESSYQILEELTANK